MTVGDALLAIDVGGSTSRACLVDPVGRCLGYGRNRGGNPASTEPEHAATAIISAVEAALADAGPGPFAIVTALIALAGPRVRVAQEKLEAAFWALGVTGPIVFAGDLQALFASATAATDGYCVVAGTGAGAVRIRGGSIDKVADAAGWLLGDFGSGYWLGLEAARAAVAELEGRGNQTSLTPALLQAFDIGWPDDRVRMGRPVPLGQLIDAVYALRPIELARFAPLVIAHRTDPVAARLIAEAGRLVTADFELVYDPRMPGPVALGGGVIPHLTGVPAAIGEIIYAAGGTPDIRLAPDGSVGAIVLAVRSTGATVSEAMLTTITSSVAARRVGSAASASG